MPDLNDAQSKAIDFAGETVKQLIALASGIIALTITFSKELLGSRVPAHALPLLISGWITYVLSILFGVFTLMAITGSLGRWAERPRDGQSSSAPSVVYGKNVTVPAALQLLTFWIGTGLIVAFAITSL